MAYSCRCKHHVIMLNTSVLTLLVSDKRKASWFSQFPFTNFNMRLSYISRNIDSDFNLAISWITFQLSNSSLPPLAIGTGLLCYPVLNFDLLSFKRFVLKFDCFIRVYIVTCTI